MPKLGESELVARIKNVFKIIILGDPSVGKTSLRLRYLGKGFQKQYIATIGADFAVSNYKESILQIWDLAGEHTFKKLVKSMFNGAGGVILVFDVTKTESLDHISEWINSFLDVENRKVPMVVVGNKIDLRDKAPFSIKASTAQEHVALLSKKFNNRIDYMETSALTGVNIQQAFEELVERMNPSFIPTPI